MTVTVASEILGFLAGAIGLGLAAPQAVRVRKLGAFGVSSPTWILTLIAYTSWLGYGLRTDSPSQIVANGISSALTIWLLTALLAGKRWKWPVIIGALVIFPTAMIFLPEMAMSAFLLSLVAATWPQVVRAWRAWRQKTPIPAVSKLSWTLYLTSGLLWVAYAALGGRVLVLFTSGLNVVASIAILALTILANKSGSEQTEPKEKTP